ncbi:CRISPR-associated protein Csn2-St [uncultured Granulicatella sp.]|uniref:CRISPR-associated protein Csn2-St n=1 Tax=uncultured Granulicatella sp. TaxID=316089 RepID=UPI0025992EB3|nr:CRISPR-associated protein Csn2-St [uncultured Granulicatella sp.]
MKWKISHPYNDFVEIEVGQYTQIVGMNQELKYYIWLLLNWYFGGKKYTENDLSLFDFEEPIIQSEEKILNRKEFKLVTIERAEDLHEQLSFKKGTIAYEYLLQILNRVELTSHIEKLNDTLEQLSIEINKTAQVEVKDVLYKVDVVDFVKETVIKNHLIQLVEREGVVVSNELIDNERKFLILLAMLERILEESPDKYLLLIKNADEYISKRNYQQIVERIIRDSDVYGNLFVLNFITNVGSIALLPHLVECINIIGDHIESLPELDFIYSRYRKHYPLSDVPSEEQFRESLSKVCSFLLVKEIGGFSFSVEDKVTLKVLNQLFSFETIEINDESPIRLLSEYVLED